MRTTDKVSTVRGSSGLEFSTGAMRGRLDAPRKEESGMLGSEKDPDRLRGRFDMFGETGQTGPGLLAQDVGGGKLSIKLFLGKFLGKAAMI